MQLTEANYYSKEADAEYMSVSQYKRWLACPAAAYAQYVDGTYQPEQTDALLHGSYFHALFEGTEKEFLNNHPELLTKKGEKTAEIQKLDRMFERVKKDEFFMSGVSGECVEIEHIFTAEFAGVKWKCKTDVVNFDKEFFTDVKTVRDFSPVWDENSRRKIEWWQSYHYDIQLAVYQELIRLATGLKLSAYIAAVTKEKVTDYEVYDFNSEDMDTHFAYLTGTVKTGVEMIQKIKVGSSPAWRCEHCDYCKQTKKLNSVKIAKI